VTYPYLVPCLVTLRSEFNELNPKRDKGADGWIGDEAHQQETSDHNPDSKGRVLALDVDSTGPWPHPFHDYVMGVINRCRNGEENRIEYIIHDHHIYERHNEFAAREYDGNDKDPHVNHAHFSARHDHTGQNSTATWHIDETDETVTDADKEEIATMAAQKVWGYMMEMPESTTTPKEKKPAGTIQRYQNVVALSTRKDILDELVPMLTAIKAALDALSTK
jgi:hypothetical protein